MEIRNKQETQRRRVNVILIIIVVVLLLATGMLVFDSRSAHPQLSVYDDDWNDLSSLSRELKNNSFKMQTIISSPSLLDNIEDPMNTVYVAIGIEKAYLYNEVQSIIDFVNRGGSVIIADDFGYGNTIAPDFDVEFVKGTLYDESFEKNPKFIVSTVDSTDLGFHGTLLFNEPVGMKIGGGRVLAKTSPHAWVDLNYNELRDITDTSNEEGYDEYPLIVESTKFENGRAVFISDPSLFINDMLYRKGNLEFAMKLFYYLVGSEGKVIIDEGRHDDQSVVSNLQQEAFNLVVVGTTNNNFKLLTGVIVILGMIIILVALSDPKDLVHRQRVSKPTLDELKVGTLFNTDAERLRMVMMERVRLGSGYSKDEFLKMNINEIAEIIDDDVLMEFMIKKKKKFSPTEMNEILKRVKGWEDVE